jgi:peptidoglycan/LPS O-acetylase OafA/YrhL
MTAATVPEAGAPTAPGDGPSPGRPFAPRHVPALDGLRAIAVLGVLAVHSGAPGARLGWLGVDLFFVLSGFLITTLLLSEHADRGRISLGRFWTRRFLRLMPAYWLYAALVTFLVLVRPWGWTATHDGWTPGLLVTSIWLYFVNYLPQGGIWEHQTFTLHLWSLAGEEQFYLVWPIAVSIGLRFGRRVIAGATWLLVAAFVAERLLSPDPGAGVHATLGSRGFGIFLGCAVALTLGGAGGAPSLLSRPALRWGVVAGVVALYAVVSWLAIRAGLLEDAIKRYYSPLFCALFALLIPMIWYGSVDLIARILAWKPAVFIGKISYGVYLYHMMCHYLVWDVLLRDIEHWNRYAKFGLRMALFVGLTIAVATASYYLIERRFLRIKSRFRAEPVRSARM